MTKFKCLVLIASFICMLKSKYSYAQYGLIDSSFNGDGKQITSFNGTARSIALQSDGKILLGGESNVSSHSDFTVVRCKKNGTIDSTFGINGRATADVLGTGLDDNCTSLSVQNDGKIVLAGHYGSGGINTIALVRFNANGTLDNSFGTGGIAIILTGGNEEMAQSMALQNDGKIVIGGQSYSGGQWDFLMARFNTNGSLDTSFGSTGIVITDIGTGTQDYLNTLVLQSDGKIIVGGMSSYNNCLVRFKSNGSLDATFGTGGKVITNITSNSQIKSIIIQSDSKIITTGSQRPGSYEHISLIRYNINGNIDSTFGTNGIVLDTIGIEDDIATSIQLQKDEKIVITGYYMATNLDAFIKRYNKNGSIDNTLGNNGKVISSIGTGSDYVMASIFDEASGKIIIAGNFNNKMGAARFSLIAGTVGVNKNPTSTKNILVSPNPFTNSLTISVNENNSENLSINVYTSEGKLIQQVEKPDATSTLSTYNWPVGIYFIEMKDKQNNYSHTKVIKFNK